MVNYQNGKIYVIRSNNTENVYIGSTTRPLSERMGEHRGDFKHNRGKSSFEVLKHGGAYIELIEDYPCNKKEQLCKREGEVMRATENTVNRNIAGRTLKEWRDEHKVEAKQYNKKYNLENKEQLVVKRNKYYKDNKENFAKRSKQYRDEHKGELAVKNKLYRDRNKEQIAVKKNKYYKDNKENFAKRSKQYRHDNKDKIAVRKKQYRDLHKPEMKIYRGLNADKIRQKKKEWNDKMVRCECGANITRGCLSRHKRNNKHKTEMFILELAGEI